MHRLTAFVVATAVVATACSVAPVVETVPPTTATTVALRVVPRDLAGFRAQPTACDGSVPERPSARTYAAPPGGGLAGPVRVDLVTSCGTVVLEIDPRLAPATAASFVGLAADGFFDGTVLHRVIPGFVVQGGDPTATGTGGPGYALDDEFPPEGFSYVRGTVAMANAGPGTTGSQFFVVLADVPLPPRFAVIGRVVDGFEALDRIVEVPLGTAPGSPDPTPSTPLETVYVEQAVVRP